MEDFHQPSTSKGGHDAPPFELTESTGGGGGGACGSSVNSAVAVVAAQPSSTLTLNARAQPEQRKRKGLVYSSDGFEVSSCDGHLSVTSAPTPASSENVRRRKHSTYPSSSCTFEDDGDETRSSRTAPDKKQNHSEIEKRRRDKMNTYITELSSMIPMCGAMARKLDKLTVLRMAVQHMRSVRGALSACQLNARPRPSFLSEKELNALILQAAQDCFLLVVGCDRGRLLYVSASVKSMLYYDQSDLLGQSLFDILHPKDVGKVKEQLSSSDLSPRERLIDIKTMMPVKADVVTGASRFCPGARRSFFCRIKCKVLPEDSVDEVSIKEESEPISKMRKKQHIEKKYCVVQCTGYLKSWAPVEVSEGSSGANEGTDETEACNMSCLVAVGRALSDLVPETYSSLPSVPIRSLQYVSRHATDGKFLFVDQRVTLALGFLPQELLGTSLYEYVSGPELGAVARTHKQSLLRRDALHTPTYSFRRKDGSLARIQTHFKPFKNPWTKDVECLVANNTVINDAQDVQQQDSEQSACDIYKQNAIPSVASDSSDFTGVSEADLEMQRLIDSQVESHKIGSAIAEEALRGPNSEFSPDLPADLLADAVFNQQGSVVDNITGVDMAGFNNQVRNNVPLSAVGGANSPVAETIDVIPDGTPPPPSPPLPPLGLDGNGEAAMAVIMSLLEAEAGLGGPVNFSGIPWPLP